ncbi:MAG: phage holin family protein [Candidatus Liptonbacteria bacterium]|nr:phage holin family protein [Candidatus Liptonbacteria bacterium]
MFRLATHILFSVFSNAAAIKAAAYFVDGVSFTGGIQDLAVAGAALMVVNMFIRPIVRFILTPFVILTLGLGIIAINAAILFGLDIFLPTLMIQGLVPLLVATFFISIVNVALQAVGRIAFRL